MKTKTIALFGGSFFDSNSEIYHIAEKAGKVLAQHGIKVKTGGYSGIMEAASKGASLAGGKVEAVIMDGLGNSPNQFVSQWSKAPDLFERTKLLIDGSDGFIVFPGKAGTLAELAFLLALKRIEALALPIFIYGTEWKKQIDFLLKEGILDRVVLSETAFYDNIDVLLEHTINNIG